jgi:hypothetical protein
MDWTQTLTIIGTILPTVIGFAVFMHREHKEELAKMDAKIDKMDDRWNKLFEKFHMLDKDVAMLKVQKGKD